MAQLYSAKARAEDLMRTLQGGQSGNQDRFEKDYARYLLDALRGFAIYEHHAKSNVRLHNTLMQPYSIERVDSEQIKDPVSDKVCAFRFKLPPVLMINDLIDGIGYIGSPNGRESFRRVRSRQELSDLYHHRNQSPEKSAHIYALTDVNGWVEIHGGLSIKKVLVNACFSQPCLVPGFDLDNDYYPINDAIMQRAKEVGLKMTLNYMASSPQDMIQNFQNELNKLKQQIVIK